MRESSSPTHAPTASVGLPHARHVLDRFHVIRWFCAGLCAVDIQRTRRLQTFDLGYANQAKQLQCSAPGGCNSATSTKYPKPGTTPTTPATAESKVFQVIEYLIRIFTRLDDNEIVMDFFSGSATSAHAVMAANARDGGNRQHIQIQMPEAIGRNGEAQHGTVADLGRKRIVAAGNSLLEAPLKGDTESCLDRGFRYLILDSSNIQEIAHRPDSVTQEELELHTENVKDDRSGEDLLFEMMLDWGLELTMPITLERIDDHTAFVVDEDVLIACFDDEVSLDLVHQVAVRTPLRAVFRDSSFLTDADRINAKQTFDEVSPSTDVKVI